MTYFYKTNDDLEETIFEINSLKELEKILEYFDNKDSLLCFIICGNWEIHLDAFQGVGLSLLHLGIG